MGAVQLSEVARLSTYLTLLCKAYCKTYFIVNGHKHVVMQFSYPNTMHHRNYMRPQVPTHSREYANTFRAVLWNYREQYLETPVLVRERSAVARSMGLFLCSFERACSCFGEPQRSRLYR